MAEDLATQIMKDLQKKLVSDVTTAAMKTLQLMPDERAAGILLISAFEDIARGCTELIFPNTEENSDLVLNSSINMLLGAAIKIASRKSQTGDTLIELARQLRASLDGMGLQAAAEQG